MPYVQRDENGKIIGRYANKQIGYAEEWLPDDSPELTIKPKEDRIAAKQVAYDADKLKLDAAWLSATIADGVGETTRKGAVVALMASLKNKLNADILAIIMES